MPRSRRRSGEPSVCLLKRFGLAFALFFWVILVVLVLGVVLLFFLFCGFGGRPGGEVELVEGAVLVLFAGFGCFCLNKVPTTGSHFEE